MKFYAIPPNKNLDLMHTADRYFCLAHHYVNDSEYRNYFLNLKNKPSSPYLFVTLDNGAAEESLVTEDVLLDIVKELRPNEVIAPDVLFNKTATIGNFQSFLDKMLSSECIKHTSLFGCPQGSSKQEWLECYEFFLKEPYVECIGLSKIAVPKCWNNVTGDKMIGVSRNECVKELHDRNWLTKPLHLLGMGEHNEFRYYADNKIPNIRSSDSCYSILAALHGIAFRDGNLTRIPTDNSYFEQTLTEAQRRIARDNIYFLIQNYRCV